MAGVGLSTSPSAPHLVLSGEVDLAVAPALRESGTEMAKLVAPGRLEIDLGDVTFIDSSGLGALISVRNASRQCGADLVLVRVSPVVARFLELAGVRDSFRAE
jgi:anti-anti-sigma factor